MRLRVLSVVVLGCSLALATRAHADDASEAKRLFEEGRKALAEGRVGTACETLSEAKRLAPDACGVVQNLATCRQQQGRYLDSWNEFDALSACASKANQSDRVKFAEDQRGSMRGKLGFLSLVVGNGPALSKLSVDAVPIDPAAFQGKPRPFEPGLHRLEIERAGCQPERLEVTLVAGLAQQLVLPATCGTAASTEPSRAPAVSALPPVIEPPKDSVQGTRWQIPVGWGAVGVGALAVVGAFAPCGLIANGQKRDGEDEKANSTATICTVLAIAGAAVAVGGLVLVLTAPSKKPAPSLSFVPRLTPREAGVAATLRF